MLGSAAEDVIIDFEIDCVQRQSESWIDTENEETDQGESSESQDIGANLLKQIGMGRDNHETNTRAKAKNQLNYYVIIRMVIIIIIIIVD